MEVLSMNCKGIQLKLAAYIDGELSGYEMIEIRGHLDRCANCQAEAEMVRQVKWVVNNLPTIEPDEQMPERLKAKVFAAEKRRRTLTLAPVAFASTAVFVLSMLGALGFLHNSRSDSQSGPGLQASSTAHESGAIARDQAYFSGTDPLAGGTVMLTSHER